MKKDVGGTRGIVDGDDPIAGVRAELWKGACVSYGVRRWRREGLGGMVGVMVQRE